MKRSWLLGRKRKLHIEEKKKYDEVVSLNINDVDLTIAQLRALINMKKWKTDKSFSSFKKIDMLCLWGELVLRIKIYGLHQFFP